METTELNEYSTQILRDAAYKSIYENPIFLGIVIAVAILAIIITIFKAKKKRK